jgi:hypothetical protein
LIHILTMVLQSMPSLWSDTWSNISPEKINNSSYRTAASTLCH